jgi:hypothetical protein
MAERKIGFKSRGAHADSMVCIQVSIPEHIDKAVERKAEQEMFSMATYYRKWIVEGYQRDSGKWK